MIFEIDLGDRHVRLRTRPAVDVAALRATAAALRRVNARLTDLDRLRLKLQAAGRLDPQTMPPTDFARFTVLDQSRRTAQAAFLAAQIGAVLELEPEDGIETLGALAAFVAALNPPELVTVMGKINAAVQAAGRELEALMDRPATVQ